MKQYFAKYLPVEGEVKEWDCYLDNNGIVKRAYVTSRTVLRNKFDTIIRTDWDGKAKVKLFLCSRNIEVGDKIYSELTKEYHTVEYGVNSGYSTQTPSGYWACDSRDAGSSVGNTVSSIPKYNSYKVIGEISPEAKWVKEGMEFDEEEIRRIYACRATISTRASGYERDFIVGDNPDPKAIDNYFHNEVEYNESHYWGESITIDEHKPFIHHIELKGQCGHFH